MTRRALVARLGTLALLVTVLVVVGVRVGLPTPTELRAFTDGLGPFAAPGFVLLYAVVCLFPLPVSVLTVAAGALFGAVEGTALVVAGATLGSTGAFALARGLGREVVQRFASPRLAALDARIQRHALRTVLVARLVPVLPFTALSYSFGLSAVTMQAHLLGTLVGTVPGSAMYVSVGAFGLRPVSWEFVVAVVGVLALLLAARLRWLRLTARAAAAASAAD